MSFVATVVEAAARGASSGGASRQVVAAAVAAATRTASEAEAVCALQCRAKASPRGDIGQLFKLVQLLEARVGFLEESLVAKAEVCVVKVEEQELPGDGLGSAGGAEPSAAGAAEPMPEPNSSPQRVSLRVAEIEASLDNKGAENVGVGQVDAAKTQRCSQPTLGGEAPLEQDERYSELQDSFQSFMESTELVIKELQGQCKELGHQMQLNFKEAKVEFLGEAQVLIRDEASGVLSDILAQTEAKDTAFCALQLAVKEIQETMERVDGEKHSVTEQMCQLLGVAQRAPASGAKHFPGSDVVSGFGDHGAALSGAAHDFRVDAPPVREVHVRDRECALPMRVSELDYVPAAHEVRGEAGHDQGGQAPQARDSEQLQPVEDCSDLDDYRVTALLFRDEVMVAKHEVSTSLRADFPSIRFFGEVGGAHAGTRFDLVVIDKYLEASCDAHATPVNAGALRVTDTLGPIWPYMTGQLSTFAGTHLDEKMVQWLAGEGLRKFVQQLEPKALSTGYVDPRFSHSDC